MTLEVDMTLRFPGNYSARATVRTGTCSSCEGTDLLLEPVMFPSSPEPNAPLKRYWWCEDCADAWLGTGFAEDASSERIGSIRSRGFRVNGSRVRGDGDA